MAMVGVTLDGVGVGLTRLGFEDSPMMQPLEANFYRTLGALTVLFFFAYIRPVNFFQKFKSLKMNQRTIVLIGAVSGTYVSLWLYLSAIQIGHLASISAIGVTSPFFAALIEHIYRREKPSKYLLIAGALFLAGFSILIR